jgi:drug/metabolite transporter (DMT)-like permease
MMTRPQLGRFLITAGIWGCTWIVIRDQIAQVPGPWSVAWRFVLAAVALGAYVRLTGQPYKLGKRGQMLAAGLGVAQFTLNFNLVYEAEARVASGLVAVVFALMFVPNALLAWAFLGHRPTARFLAGSAVGVVGVGLMFHDQLALSRSGAIGLGLAIAGMLCASTANVAQAGPLGRRLPFLALLAAALGYGALFDCLAAWITTGPPVFAFTPSYIAGLAFMGLAATVLAFLFYYPLIRQIGAGRAAYVNMITPVIAMALTSWFEGFVWTAWSVGGALVTGAGVTFALTARRT